jgi:hypothetical protein
MTQWVGLGAALHFAMPTKGQTQRNCTTEKINVEVSGIMAQTPQPEMTARHIYREAGYE